MQESSNVKSNISNDNNLTTDQKEFAIMDINMIELALEPILFDHVIVNPINPSDNEIEECSGDNPTPAPGESSDSYVPRCIEQWINENLVDANFVDQVWNVANLPRLMAQTFVSCEWTYYTCDDDD